MPDGNKKRIYIRANTKKELEAKYIEKKLAYEKGEITVNSNTLFSRWAKEWLETYKKPSVTDGTLSNIRHIVNKFFLPYLGNLRLSDIKTIHIQHCMNHLQGYSKSVINKAYNYINSMLEKAVINNLINRNPCIGIVKPQGYEKINRRSLTAEEEDLFMQAIKTHEKGLLFGIMLACGLRPSEARALTWQDIDLKTKTVSIRQTIEYGKTTTKAPKSKAGFRTIPLPNWYIEMFKQKAIPSIDKNEFIFFSFAKKPMPKQKLERAWHSLVRDMDIAAGAKLYRNEIIEHAIDTSITPYYLRHTYATKLAEKGIDMKTAQYLLGHSDIKMTAQIYTHVTSKMLDTAREKINII